VSDDIVSQGDTDDAHEQADDGGGDHVYRLVVIEVSEDAVHGVLSGLVERGILVLDWCKFGRISPNHPAIIIATDSHVMKQWVQVAGYDCA
jgi:hypothetical protein